MRNESPNGWHSSWGEIHLSSEAGVPKYEVVTGPNENVGVLRPDGSVLISNIQNDQAWTVARELNKWAKFGYMHAEWSIKDMRKDERSRVVYPGPGAVTDSKDFAKP